MPTLGLLQNQNIGHVYRKRFPFLKPSQALLRSFKVFRKWQSGQKYKS
jgi:hypothetical protein